MIHFHYETGFKLNDEQVYRQWVASVIASEARETGEINYIFCDDAYLQEMHIKYLKNNTLTDIISFDYSKETTLSGDIFISVERVKDNARAYKVRFEEELLRVMAHGLLHCCGYNDKTDAETAVMRSKEEEKIKMFHVKQS